MSKSTPLRGRSSSSRLIVISAPSGTGKTTLCARLLKEIPELILSISTTTRKPRGQEKHGVEYFFASIDEFKAEITANGFAEWAEVHGNFYGTSNHFIRSTFAAGKSLLLDIDVQGADSLKKAYPSETVRIFLSPPSMQELERRLRSRGTDTEESIQKRLLGAVQEMAHLDHFDHVVVNDDLEKAYFQLAGIVSHAIRGNCPGGRFMTDSQKTLEKLKTAVRSYFPDAPLEKIDKAYLFAEKAHAKQKRSSGDPYIIHPTEVALSLAEMHLDLATIMTGLLHDTVEDTGVTLETIEAEFGKDVAELVDGVTKLSKITFRTTEEKQAENFRKMIIAMAKDIRVILVKLADRMNNMRTLKYLAPEKQQRIAQETLDIYAPIANRLGIGWMKIELEDLCLRYLHPDVYTKLSELVQKKKGARDKFIDSFTELLQTELDEYEIKAQIAGRAKHFFSIYKKMDRRKVDFDQIHDLIAFRIVVENITECYKALGVIHAAFKPIPGRFKDYIAMPKANSYQSLHTTVIGTEGDRIEIQIRTQEMNSVAESGIAAHWKYKEGRFGTNARENVEWVNRLLEWNKDLSDPTEFLETVKIDLFAEDVFVFTPNGEVKELPYGATPLDFAYAVHTNVGNTCVGAKVNGKIVPLKYRLKSGDTIEIVTNASGGPSKDWLKIVKTSRAKAKIRAVIKQQERDKALEIGKELLEKSIKPYGLSHSKIEKSGDFERLWKDHLQLRSPDEMYIALGYGRLFPEKVVEFLVPQDAQEKKMEQAKGADQTFLKKVLSAAKRKTESKNAILVADLDDILIRFGRCCSPLPGDSIVGFITRGRGVTVHTASCTKALDNDQGRRVDVQWNRNTMANGLRRQVRIRILCLDQAGLLAVMSQTISACNVNISSANIRTTKDKKAIAVFDVEVQDIQQLMKVTSALEGKKGVISVERVKS